MANIVKSQNCSCTRRDLLRTSLAGLGVSAGLPAFLQQAGSALAQQSAVGAEKNDRILLVVELAGGLDGLSAVVPIESDHYYRARPSLAIPRTEARRVSDEFGFHPRAEGFESLFKDGKMAVVHGCGYANSSLSHFSSLAYWHTAVPHGADPRGWLGRFADDFRPDAPDQYIVNVGVKETMAVRSGLHAPITFSDPEKFKREASVAQRRALARMTEDIERSNPTLSFLNKIDAVAAQSSVEVKEACEEYRTTIDYGGPGSLRDDLQYVAALIDANFPTRIYYTSTGGWDTHGNQLPTLQSLLMYASDALRAFLDDMERIGRADDVAIMVFSEFGRRVKENASGGTDHGTAGPMFVLGKHVKGGWYGKFPGLNDLDENGNLRVTTDFRSVYATMIEEWMGFDGADSILKGDFPPLGIFA
ncbi:MAG: DUF1501 domain-containing protein [Bryobacterales bacterium]|nr:DUF1501 domain-containing protein [Bryobacterales bacterium]